MAFAELAARTAATPRRRFGRAWTGMTCLAGVALTIGVAGCATGPSGDDVSVSATTTEEPAAGADSTTDTADTADAQLSGAPIAREGETAAVPGEADVSGLLWMREEEQLAHDVYTVLGDVWGLRIFYNIAEAEQRHIERVAGLLERYGIEDPMAGHVTGSFTIPDIQALYDQLVAAGRESSVDALEVGALIEETDIADLRRHASDVTDIQVAYTELEEGSQNHLRAFVRQLDSRGVGYEPDVLDPAEFDQIVAGR